MAAGPGHDGLRRPGGRSARVRAAVLAATLDALLEHGADKLSVADVARRAGVHETSVYRRWGSRSNLALDAVLDHVDAHVTVPDTGSLRADLLALAQVIAAFIRTPLGETLVRIGERHDLPEFDDARRAFWAARFAAAARVLDRAEARGELRAGIDRPLVVQALVGPLTMRHTLTHQPVDDDFVTGIVDLLMPALATRPPDHGPIGGAGG